MAYVFYICDEKVSTTLFIVLKFAHTYTMERNEKRGRDDGDDENKENENGERKRVKKRADEDSGSLNRCHLDLLRPIPLIFGWFYKIFS